jgi:hypothetical protein
LECNAEDPWCPTERSRRRLLLEPLEKRRLLSATRLDDAPQLCADVSRLYEVSPDGRFGAYIADAEVDARSSSRQAMSPK